MSTPTDNDEPTPTKMAVTCHTVADPEKGVPVDCPENGVTYVVNMYPASTPADLARHVRGVRAAGHGHHAGRRSHAVT